MVAKISVGNSLYGAIAYNGEKINEAQGRLLTTNRIYNDGSGTVDIGKAMEGFLTFLPPQMKIEKPVVHISLNPHPEDVLTDIELQNIGRTIALEAGIPETVCAHSINMVCGSGLRSVMEAVMSIQAGFNDIVLAGGVESMSLAPYLVPANTRSGNKMGNWQAVDHMIYDALTDARANIHMGITAENIAAKFTITREQQDEFAFASQQKAIAAIDAGKFKNEIVPITIHNKKGDIVFDTDEFPNRTTNLEKLAKLKPAFKGDGTVTAGNASGINDGASFVLIASEAAVKKYNLKPIAEIVGIGQGGVDPLVMGLGPVPAIRNALNYASLKLSDMELIELNEAFAAQSLGVIHELVREHGVDRDALLKRTNVNGGASP